ncbi:MAG TPA: glycosyltransferase family 2 protein [Polyangiaceae bacterium]|nr:glycosyltransferase family 2 protein [Polyangiaceae bacterium]
MSGLVTVLGAAALALVAPGAVYLAALTAAAASPTRREGDQARRGQPGDGGGGAPVRVVIVVPAHDESKGILRTLRRLQAEVVDDAQARIVVVADNCSDDTAAVALSAGVDVLERTDPAHRGKGPALAFGFAACRDADWLVVVDADTDVEPGFLATMRRAMVAGADALQCRYVVRDAAGSHRAALADVAAGAWNVVRPRGRAALGLSVGILGNGFALSRRTLQAVPYTASSIVEDVEYHQLLVRAGLRVRWVDDATVRGDVPSGRASAGQQRARWEGGRLRLLVDRAPSLLRRALTQQWRLLDPLLDLCLLPLAWHVALLLVAALCGSWVVRGLSLAGLGVVALHVLLALVVMPARRPHLVALLGVPFYVVWKLCLTGATWRAAARDAAWVRTPRDR